MIFGLLVGLTIPILLGDLILYFLDSNKILKPAENLTLSFLLGYPATTLLLFWSFFIDVPYRVIIIGGVVTAMFVVINIYHGGLDLTVVWIRQLKQRIMQLREAKLLNIKRILLFALLILIVFKLSYAFIETCSKPEYSWDACAFWTMDGKYFYHLNQEQPGQILKLFLLVKNYHVDYPKQIPLMHCWLFSWMGEANDQWSKVFFPISLVCFLVLFYASLRKIRGNLGAGFFTYILLTSPFFLYASTIGYADFTLSVYFSTGVILFHRWILEKEEVYFWLFTIFIALTTWIKLEGKLLYILGFALLLIYNWNNSHRSAKSIMTKMGQYISAYIVIGLPWQLFVSFNHLETREKFGYYLPYFIDLHNQIYTKLFNQGSWGVFWIAFMAAVMFSYKTLLKTKTVYLMISFLLFYGIVLFIYQFTDDGYGIFSTSFNRVWISIYPVAVFLFACIVPKMKLSILGED